MTRLERFFFAIGLIVALLWLGGALEFWDFVLHVTAKK